MSSTVRDFVKDSQNFASRTANKAQAVGSRGFNAVNDAAQQAMEAASDATDTVLKYTKKNPGKALLLAAASGALLFGLVKALTPSRD